MDAAAPASWMNRLTRGRRAWWIIGALAALAALAGVFSMPPLDRDESRFAQATAQMLETGDFVRINFQDEPRHKKPVGIHWMQAAVVAVVSSAEARDIWAYRLPSVIGVILAALATFWAGTRLVGREAAFAGAALFSVTVLLGIEGGIAKTDAMLAGLTTLAMAALASIRTGGGKTSAIIFWVAMGLGILIKGPVTPMVAGLAIIAIAAWERKLNWLKPLAFWPGPILMVAIALPWLVAVQIATDGGFLREALGDDLGPKLVSGHERHGGLPGYHLLLLPLLFFPAIFFLPAGVARLVGALRGRESGDSAAGVDGAGAARFLICWAVPTWLVFEILPTKLPHYVLPAYPALALAAGLGWLEMKRAGAWLKWSGWGLAGFAGGVFAIALPALFVVYGATFSPEAVRLSMQGFEAGIRFGVDPVLSAQVFLGAAIFITLFGAALAMNAHRATAAALALAVLAGLGWHVMARGLTAPNAYALRLAEQVREIRESSEALTGLSPENIRTVSTFTEPSLVFELGTDTILAGTTQEAIEAAAAIEEPVMLVIDLSRDPGTRATFLRDEESVPEDWWAIEAAIASGALETGRGMLVQPPGGAEPDDAAMSRQIRTSAGRSHLLRGLIGLEPCRPRLASGLNYSLGDPVEMAVYFTRCANPEDALLGGMSENLRILVRVPRTEDPQEEEPQP